VVFETGVYLGMSRSMLYDALVVSGLVWNLVVKGTSHLSMHLAAKAAAGCQVGKVAQARIDPQISQVALVRYCNADLTVVFEVAADNRSHGRASRCEHVGRLELQSSMHTIAEVVADSVAAGTHIDAAVAEDCSAAVASRIEIAGAIVCMQAAAAMRKSHWSGCLENMHTDHPWVRLSLGQELQGRRRDCTEPDMEQVLRWHSSEDYTAVSDLAVIEAIEHNAGDCTSEVAGIDQHTTMRTKLLAAKQDCCSSILLVIAAPGLQWAAGCMYAARGIAAAVEAAGAAAVAGLGILHFAPAGIDCIDRIDLGNDWTKAAGIGRLGSKTFCRGSGCGRA